MSHPTARASRTSWIVVGPVPPVLHGVAFMTPHLLEGMRRVDALAAHLDTSDRRPAYTTNKVDLLNVGLALKHVVELGWKLAQHRAARLYVPVSQGRWGFLRDVALIGLARIARRPVTLHLHGGLFGRFYAEAPAWERGLIRRVLREVDGAWVLTEAQRQIFAGLIPDDRVEILSNTSEDAGEGGSTEGDRRAGDEFRLLFLSNLFPSKGVFDLIDALDGLGEDAAGVTLRLVGESEPDVAAEVERRAAELRPSGVRIEYGGVRTGDAKLAEYRWADAFVLPSRYPPEGQPLVLLEAMSASLPIVASDHAGIPWTVRDGIEGLIVAPGDIEGIGHAVMRLMGDPSLRRTLGENGRRRYSETYSNEAFYEAIGALATRSTD